MRGFLIAAALLLPGSLFAQSTEVVAPRRWGVFIPAVHAGRDVDNKLLGASLGIGLLRGRWELRGTVARLRTPSNTCQDDCPISANSTGDLGLLYHPGQRQTKVYVGGGFGWIEAAGLTAAVHLSAGHDQGLGRHGLIRVELRVTQGLEGYTRGSWMGGSYRADPVRQLTLGIGLGFIGPM